MALVVLVVFVLGATAPCLLHFVVEPDSVKQSEATVEGDWCVVNLANVEQLLDANIRRWPSLDIEQMSLHVVVLLGDLRRDSHQELVKERGLLMLFDSFCQLFFQRVRFAFIVHHQSKGDYS